MQTVYRVQNADGRGPYNVDHPHRRELNLAHRASDSHPSFWNDGINAFCYGENKDDGSIWVCGFDTESMMKQWFGNWLPLLESVGFSVVKFQVKSEHICAGTRQLTFDITKATVLPNELAEAA